jgi:hypothetical protein
MIFVNGVLIGGASELQQLVENGEFSAMLARCASSDVLAYSPGRRRGARAQRVEQAAQVVVVEFVHQRDQAAQFARGEALAGEPAR